MSEILDIYAKSPKGKDMLNMYSQSEPGPKSAIIDPYEVNGIHGLRAKPTAIPFNLLRQMAEVPAIAAIVNTRLNQVARFARRPRFEGDMGFKVVLKERDAKMNEVQKKRAFEIEEFFMKTGAVPNACRKDNFDKFLRKVVRDTLTIDAMVWENVGNLKGNLVEMWAVDAATIEIVSNSPAGDGNIMPVYEPITRRGIKDAGRIAYVQKIDGQIVAEYTEAELCYAIRNPRTDVHLVDFGMSELETLIEIVTGIVNGVRYNTSYFSESHLPQGVLEIIGKYKETHLEQFKRYWKTMTSGAGGKWAVPVMALEDGQGFKFTPFKSSNRDMEFNEFLEFLFNIGCAVYQIDPNEVGFKSWTSSNSMTKSDNTKEKIDQSKDKGFAPLMQFLANTFNSEVIDRIDEDYCITWVGLDDEDEQAKLERDKANVEMGKVTIAELRKRDDMEEILDDDGNPAKWTLAPGNPTLIQAFMADMQAAQQADQAQMQQQQQAQQSAQAQMDAEGNHARQLEIMDKQHSQNMEAKKFDSTTQHKNQLAIMDKQHGQAKDMANFQHEQATKDGETSHKRGIETKKMDQQHQLKIEAMKQKGKDKDKPLKKSIDTDDVLDIEIDWTDY